MIARLRAVPPVAWVVLTAVVGLAVLAWHQYAQDDQDTDWTSAKESPAPIMAPLAISPGAHGSGSPMSCNGGFRSRSWPSSLADADCSIIGEF